MHYIMGSEDQIPCKVDDKHTENDSGETVVDSHTVETPVQLPNKQPRAESGEVHVRREDQSCTVDNESSGYLDETCQISGPETVPGGEVYAVPPRAHGHTCDCFFKSQLCILELA